MDKKFKAVRSDSLSTLYENRFIMIDTETGEIADDAQGYGYKTIQKAYAGFSYKNRTPKLKSKQKELEKKLKTWCNRHEDFVRTLEQFAFEIQKGSWGADAKVDAKMIQTMFKEWGFDDVDFTPGEFLRYWKKH